MLWCAVGVAVAALARAKQKGQKYDFLSRIHRLRSCGASGVREKRGGNVRLDMKMRRRGGSPTAREISPTAGEVHPEPDRPGRFSDRREETN